MALQVFDNFGNGNDGGTVDTTIGYFAGAKVLPLAGGGWVIVGKQGSGANQGSIVAQNFDAGGEPVGSETVLYSDADLPPNRAGFYIADATFLSNGKLAVSFGVVENNGQFTTFAWDVYTRTYQAGSYAPASALVQADTGNADGQQYAGPITALADGGYAIMWRSYYSTESNQQVDNGAGGTTGRASDLYLRTFNADGTPRAAQVLAQGSSGPDLAYDQGAYGHDIAGLAGGRIVTAYTDNENLPNGGGGLSGYSGNSYHIATSTGAPAGVADDGPVGTFFGSPAGRGEGGLWGNPSVQATADGGFVIVFAERYTIRGDQGSIAHFDHYVKAQRYDANGAQVGSEATIEYSRDLQVGNSVAATVMADGRIAVAYSKDWGDGTDPKLVTLASNLGSADAGVRVRAGGDDNVGDVLQNTDGTLMVSLGGGFQRVVRVVDAAAGATVTSGDVGSDTLGGSGVADWLDGRAGDDILQGLGGDDHLFGGAGKDTLAGGTGADLMVGGSGDDAYEVDNAADVVTEIAGGGVDTVVSLVSGYALGANIENLVMGGSIAVGFGNSGANAIFGNAANNTLNGAGGADVMIGGAGNDDYQVAEVGDQVVEQAGQGTDSVFSFLTEYGLSANVENLILVGSAVVGFGNAGDNGLFGNAGANTLIGGAGNDLMAGGAGDDTYEVTEAGDVVSEAAGQGTDQVFSFVDGYVLAANVENLILAGSTVTGFGNASANAVIGNAAANNVGGGGGDDFVVGGAGVDTFFWTGTSAGKDVLVDFAQANEKIVVSSSMFANFAAVQSHAFQAGGDTVISYDSNTLLVLKNTTLATLTAGNFVFSAGEPGDPQPQAAVVAGSDGAGWADGPAPISAWHDAAAHASTFDWVLA